MPSKYICTFERTAHCFDTAVEAALEQIEEQKYVTELMDRGIKNIKKLAVVFSGKDVYVKENRHQ